MVKNIKMMQILTCLCIYIYILYLYTHREKEFFILEAIIGEMNVKDIITS